jgi:hypothetical protein
MTETTTLFHRSSRSGLDRLGIGDAFTLLPGPQGAEGRGVYFSEGRPCSPTTAEGCHGGQSAIVEIRVDSPRGWWRTKPALARRHGRPRTWHTDGAAITCRVLARSEDRLVCSWELTVDAGGSHGR